MATVFLEHCHQGHSKFGSSAGKQCVMNSLVSLMYSKVEPIRDWNIEDMNVVLKTGNELYQFLTRSSTMHDIKNSKTIRMFQ